MSIHRCAPPTNTDRHAERPARGFLSRLKRAEAGNVLPMMAMALVPIAGMIGSGLDMSRAYLVKAKLQTACDSTALAARRFMGGSPFTTAARDEGRKFFDFNFPAGIMGTDPVAVTIRAKPSATDVVEVSANTNVRTSIMKMFGKERIAVAVACEADQDFVHNDIMLVLDVTGSMNCTVGTSCAYAETMQTNSRLAALRNAAGALYRSLQDADDDIQIRYGFMPYSMTVNVSRDLNALWTRTSSQYWRRPNTSTAYSLTNVTHSSSWLTSWRSNAAADAGRGCIEERSTIGSGGTGAVPRITTAVAQADIDQVSTSTDALKWNPYNPETATGNMRQEELTSSSVPANLRAFCPARARRLAEYASEAAFNTEVTRATSRVGGYTNHDIGMMWGMRYLSGTGMFAAANPDEIDDMRVDRHIIFMTDGDMTALGQNYSAYGMPAFQNRWSTSGTSDAQLEAKHQSRFLAACNRARSMGPSGTTIWVVALDVGSTAPITPCANSGDHFFAARSAAELERAFDTIGKEIGKLRLTK